MARLRAVVTIHAPGLGGWPCDGHRATATVNASWTASSAASMSPRKRIRVATQRPYSRRKTASTVTAPEPAAAARTRSQLAVGNQEAATGRAHHGRRLRPEHAAVEHEHASVLHRGVEPGDVGTQSRKLLR